MIILHQFPGSSRHPNYSPFCLKLETYLRLAGIPYQVHNTVSMKGSPKMKMPFIEMDGRLIGDSTLIIDHLKNVKGDLLDGHLTGLQKAHSVAYQRLLEENVAPAMVYHRWQTDHGWDRFSRILFHKAPALVRILIGGRLRKKTIKALYSQGMGRHSEAEVLEILRKDLRALAEFLGENRFFFGEKPSTLDCVAFGVLGNLFSDANLLLQGLGSEFPNLKAHADRMHQLYTEKAAIKSSLL